MVISLLQVSIIADLSVRNNYIQMYASNMHLLIQNVALAGKKHCEINSNTLSIDLPNKSVSNSMIISNARAYKSNDRCIFDAYICI